LGYFQKKLENHSSAIFHLTLKGTHICIGFSQLIVTHISCYFGIQQAPVPAAIKDRHPVGRRCSPPKPPKKGAQLFVSVRGSNATNLKAAGVKRLNDIVYDCAFACRTQSFYNYENGNAIFPALSLQVTQFSPQFFDILSQSLTGLRELFS
jgi:hypothetical protein